MRSSRSAPSIGGDREEMHFGVDEMRLSLKAANAPIVVAIRLSLLPVYEILHAASPLSSWIKPQPLKG